MSILFPFSFCIMLTFFYFIQTRDPTPELTKGAAKAVYDFYDVVTHELLSSDLRLIEQNFFLLWLGEFFI